MATEENAIIPSEITAGQIAERVAISGDLSVLRPNERVAYYVRVCESLGLNPLTKPFDYITLNGKLTLYAKRDATDQIRRLNGVNVTKLEYPAPPEGLFAVVAYGRDRSGREDSASGIVSIRGLAGDALANAMMKAETKAKRRLTLSLVGLGLPDETEIASIPDAEPANVDERGVIQQPPSLADRVAARVESLKPQIETGEAPKAETPKPTVRGSAAAAAEQTPVDEPEESLVPNADQSAQSDSPADAEESSEQTAVTEDEETPAPSTVDPLADFASWAATRDRDQLRSIAKTMFPDASGFRTLSPDQLAELREVVEATEREKDDDAPAEAPAVESKPNLCGEQSPLSPAVCTMDAGHKGPHRAGTRESW